MEKRKAYEEKLAAQIEEWNAQLALLNAKTHKATAETKIECCAVVEALQNKFDEATTRLQELKSASDEKWEEIKKGEENIWSDVKAAFQSAALTVK